MSDAGKRRPEPRDLDELLFRISEGESLRSACRAIGLDPPSTHRWLDDDEGRRQQYARAKEQRAEHFQEEALTITRAAAIGASVQGKKIDPAGVRVYLDAIKWATARMAPKAAPVQRHEHNFSNLTDEELEARIAALLVDPADDDDGATEH